LAVTVASSLALAATVLLVLGPLGDGGLLLILLSVACSVAAAIVLTLGRRRTALMSD
jgi:hypothetical protein